MRLNAVVVYHVTIVAIGHGLLKKFWPFGTRLRSTQFYCDKMAETNLICLRSRVFNESIQKITK